MSVQGRDGPRRLRRAGLALMAAGTALILWPPPFSLFDLIAIAGVVGATGVAGLALRLAHNRARSPAPESRRAVINRRHARMRVQVLQRERSSAASWASAGGRARPAPRGPGSPG